MFVTPAHHLPPPIVRRPASGGRWYLTGKMVDGRGRAAYRGHIAGAGDITVIRDAPTYKVGSTVRYQGLDHIVLEDRGDDVELGVPKHTSPTRGTELVRIPSGNVHVVSKPDLALAAM